MATAHPCILSLCQLGSDSILGTSAGLSWKEAMQNLGVWWA